MRRLVAAGFLIALLGCVPEATEAGVVRLSEYDVAVASQMAPGGIDLLVNNDGQFGHTLLVSTADGTVLGSTHVIGPGQSSTLTLDLEPGRYQFSCRIAVQIPDGSIVDHYSEGMNAMVVVAWP